MYIKVESKTAPYSDVAKSFKVMINPWQVGWLHNWDCRSGTPPETLRTTPAKIGIVEVGLGFNGRDFSIDDRLRMTMLRKYRFQFRPLIVRNDLAHPTPTYDSVGDGKFKFRIALLMNRSDMSGADDPSARFITSYESVVEARNGIVVEEVPLKFLFRELPLIGTRSEVFMELAPLDAKNGLIATTWRAPVHIATDETMNTLEPTVLDIGKLIAEGQKMKAELDAKYDAGAETLKASRNAQSLLGVARLTNEDAKAIGLAKADVASLMVDAGNNPKLAAKFCPLFFDGTVEAPQGFGQKLVAVFRKPKSDLEKCQADPKTYLTVGRAKQIEKVVTQPREIRGDTFTMSMSATFSKNSSLSVYTGASLGLELPVFGAKMVEMESYLGARIDQTRTFMQNATTMRALMAEQIELEFEAQARDCLYVSGKGARDPKPTRFTCTQPEAKQETIRESWFMVTQIQDHSSTLLRDPRLLKERSWCKLVRGASLFQRFKDLVDDKNNYWILTPFTIKNDLNASGSAITSAAKQAFKGDFVIEDGNFPGLIIE
jgi:hypothetical protein